MVKLEKVRSRLNKHKVTFSIDNEVIRKFNKFSKKLKINKSLLIEEMIKEFLNEYLEKFNNET